MSALLPDTPRKKPPANSVADLITNGLGYCCEYFFFHHFTDAELIAARLGVTPDTIRRHKRWFREGQLTCTCGPRCAKRYLKEI